jgi:protein required for attachment to host cells
MQLPHGATVAVSDGQKISMFRNSGTDAHMKLEALPHAAVEIGGNSSGTRHHSSPANPDESGMSEDSFAAATAELLNKGVLDGRIKDLVVIAAPRTLGELRKHYHKNLTAVLKGEIAKDLTGHTTADIEKALSAA